MRCQITVDELAVSIIKTRQVERVIETQEYKLLEAQGYPAPIDIITPLRYQYMFCLRMHQTFVC